MLVLAAFAVAMVLTPVSAMAQGQQPTAKPQAGWLNNANGWIVEGTGQADPGCTGNIVMTQEGKDNQSFRTFAAAQEARGSDRATYWCEPAAQAGETQVDDTTDTDATDQGATTGAKAGTEFSFTVNEDLTAAETDLIQESPWANWVAGISPIVFSEKEGVLNVLTLSKLDFKGLDGGVTIALEPWRAGCGKVLPQTQDDDCNVGKAFLFSTPEGAVDWLIANEWWEGSLWYRDDLTVTGTEPNITCVAALNAPGKAINYVPGQYFCPDGIPDPSWVVEGMFAYPPVAKALNDARTQYSQLQEEAQQLQAEKAQLERELAELRALRDTFCASNPTADACTD